VAYIGRPSIVGNFVKLDSITAVNGQAAYTMQNNSVNFVDYSTVNQFMVSLNSVVQSPGSSFTVSGSTITFASNLVTGDVIDFIIVFGNSLSAGTPTDDTVTAAKLNDDIISGQTALASEPADTDEFLVSDAGTLKRIDYSLIKGGGITEADQWRLSSNFETSSGDITANLERNDSTGYGKIGTGMSESSGIFTFASTGIYLVEFNVLAYGSGVGDVRYAGGQIYVTTNNSSYSKIVEAWNGCNQHGSPYYFSSNMKILFDVTDTSTHKVKFNVAASATVFFNGTTTENRTHMTFIRLGDT